MSIWREYNPNPYMRNTIDCAVRAVAKALDTDWRTAKALIAVKAYNIGGMDSGNATWGEVLHDHGFRKALIPDTCPYCYTAADFARDNPRGVFVLGFGSHVATLEDGILYDSWDSSREIPQYYWYLPEV